MEVVFLGTGSAIPIPRPENRRRMTENGQVKDAFRLSSVLRLPSSVHNCPQCQSKDPRDRRWPSALLIDHNILIDASPPILELLRSVKVDPKNVRTVVLTHRHSDASSGLPVLSKGVHLVFPREAGNFRVETHQFEAVGVPHDPRTWGYLIDGQLAYFSDYSDIKPALPALKRAKMAVLDGSGWESAFPTHQPMKTVIGAVKQISSLEQIYFTHVGHTGLPHGELERRAKELGGDRLAIAYHGLSINA